MISMARLRRTAVCLAALLGAMAAGGCAQEMASNALTSPLNGTQKIDTAAAVGASTVGAAQTSAPKATEVPSSVETAKPHGPKAMTIAAGPAVGTGYRIGPLDVLEITVFQVPELSKTVQVAEKGTINLPLVGDIVTLDRTAQDIERDLTARLGAKYLRSPQVSVFVKEFNSQRITVEGAVRKPGVFPMRGRTTLMQAVALSEGIEEQTASGAVTIFRQLHGKREALQFDLSEIRSGQKEDPEVRASDLVVVDVSAGKQAFNNFLRVVPVANVLRPF